MISVNLQPLVNLHLQELAVTITALFTEPSVYTTSRWDGLHVHVHVQYIHILMHTYSSVCHLH